MATYILDIDGCLFFQGTDKVIPGAKELIEDIKSKGHSIILTTRRGDKEFEKHTVYSREATIFALRMNRIEYDHIIFDLNSPRIVVNDDGAYAHNHDYNKEWLKEEKEDLMELSDL